MAYIDEEIAKILRKERMKEQEEELLQEEQEADDAVDEDEIIEGIRNGKCVLWDRIFEFAHYTILDGRAEIYLPSEEINIQKDETTFFQSLNNEVGFSSSIVLSDIMEEFSPLSVYKDNIVKNMRKTGMKFKWQEEGSLFSGKGKIQYLDFISMSGLGAIHNSMWFVMTPYGRLQTTLNYDHEEHKYWKHLMRGLMKLFEIK